MKKNFLESRFGFLFLIFIIIEMNLPYKVVFNTFQNFEENIMSIIKTSKLRCINPFNSIQDIMSGKVLFA